MADSREEDQSIRAIMQASPAGLLESPVGPALERFWSSVGGPARAPMTQGSLARRPFTWSRAVYTTAALACAIVLALVIHLHTGIHVRIYQAARGQQTRIRLADNTNVVLAPESRLIVPGAYTSGLREVRLEGEGYFSVVHDVRHPFVVLTRNVQINDVGTEFDVRAYDDAIRVAVAHGSVVVGAGRGNGATAYSGHSFGPGTVSRTRPASPFNTPPAFQGIPLSAGDIAEFAHGVPTVIHHADIASATAWLQGHLIFDDTPLSDVVRELARTYNLDITISDTALVRYRVTGQFGAEPVDEVLDNVALSVGAHVERQGKRVTFMPGERATSQPLPRPKTSNVLVDAKPGVTE